MDNLLRVYEAMRLVTQDKGCSQAAMAHSGEAEIQETESGGQAGAFFTWPGTPRRRSSRAGGGGACGVNRAPGT